MKFEIIFKESGIEILLKLSFMESKILSFSHIFLRVLIKVSLSKESSSIKLEHKLS